MNLIMRANTRDYWELIEKKYFPRETKNYVPKLIAVIILSEQLYKRERFAQKNFEVFPDVISVSVPAPIKLSKIAKKLGLSTQKLKQFNPHLRRSYTPPIYRNYRLWVPENTKKANLNRLLAMKANPSLIGRRYKVRRGDSIYLIAKRYKKSISHIKSINRLTSNRIYPGQVLNI